MEIDKELIEEDDDFEAEETSRELVVPGEVLTKDLENFLPGRVAIFNNDRTKIVSLNIGLKQIKKNYINVIPLGGFYTPRPGDKVLALVVDKNPVKYKCDINAKDGEANKLGEYVEITGKQWSDCKIDCFKYKFVK